VNKSYSYITRFLLLLVFLFPDFAKAFHSHGNNIYCDGKKCCELNKDKNKEKKTGNECEICKFSKYSFNISPFLYNFLEKLFSGELIINLVYSLHKNYFLSLGLQRSPPVI